MSALAYYNEHDAFAAAWLQQLLLDDLIAPGVVDTRSIEDVTPNDLRGFTQVHFFAGIGVWSAAARLVGWPDDRPLWTGSCPCQPFSAAGKGGGFADERHLWPAMHWLVAECRPELVVGEQVASTLATGKPSNDYMRDLWRRKATLGILKDRLERDLSVAMQSVSEHIRAGWQRRSQGFDCEPRKSTDRGSQDAGGKEKLGFRSDGRMAFTEVAGGFVRGDRNSTQSRNGSGLGHPLFGSDMPGFGIHDSEHSLSSVRFEHGLRGLGRGSFSSGGGGDIADAVCEIRRAVDWTDLEIESLNGQSWLDTLQADMEGLDYAFGCVPFPAASVGAPHIRDRTYWVADATSVRHDGRRSSEESYQPGPIKRSERLCDAVGLADSDVQCERPARTHAAWDRDAGGLKQAERLGNAQRARLERFSRHGDDGDQSGRVDPITDGYAPAPNGAGGLANAHMSKPEQLARQWAGPGKTFGAGAQRESDRRSAICEMADTDRPSPTNGLWRDADWLGCTDGKWRPVEPGTFPLANAGAFRNRVGELRGAGNAVNLAQAAEFLRCLL